jgi:voltage-gated potassium channel
MLGVFGTAIWITFIVEFTLRFALAPRKGSFLRRNWLTVIALVVPAFRLLRGLRVLKLTRAARGFQLVRIVGTANRGMNALRASLSRHGLGYVIGLTVLMALLGAGGMLAFEPAAEAEGGFASYADALWWTGMLLTTMGSEFWPQSLEGRILCFLLSLYGFAVFGYITASFASLSVLPPRPRRTPRAVPTSPPCGPRSWPCGQTSPRARQAARDVQVRARTIPNPAWLVPLSPSL